METLTRLAKLEALAKLIEKQTKQRMTADGMTSDVHDRYCKVQVKPGKKYTKVDVGQSGKYMVTEAGEIFGIKAYGVIHTGHQYGTLDTINEWYWGDYTAKKRDIATA